MIRLPLVALSLVLALPTAPAAPAADLVVKVGRPLFWSGSGSGAYQLDVRGTGNRLRIGIDHATVGDVFTATVEGPEGETGRISPGNGLYSAEYIANSPARGRWVVNVSSNAPLDPRFRLRALLENAPRPPRKRTAVLPNLQAMPPYELTFSYPLTNGTTGGAPQGAPIPAGRTACHPEEVAEERAVRCLRMAFGVRNTGQGPMQLHYPNAPAGADQPLVQRVRYNDGSYVDRPAGLATFHETHGHWHHAEAVGLQLLRVTDGARGALQSAGPEHRKGFAHRDELLREWRVFYPTWDRFGFGLLAGWGDYYEWDRPGNYIDLALNPDGAYVIRMTADPGNGILESNDRDNTSYSYFRVTLDRVELLETGRGRDPWDACKIVMPFGAEPEPAKVAVRLPSPRPKSCPPDTI